MANPINSFMERISQKRALRRWRRVAKGAQDMDIATLRAARSSARNLKRPLNDLIHIADSRLMLPMIGADVIRTQQGADWTYRPEIWRGPVTPHGLSAVHSKTMIGDEATVFHDCKTRELILRQVRNTRKEDLAPFGLQVDIFKFDGSFLSIVLDLPDGPANGLCKKHLLRMDAIIQAETPLKISARLNIKHGPNTEQMVRELPLHQDDVMVEFDLAYTGMNENRIERMWIDLIFDAPQMNQITLRDITFSRRTRAEL